MFFTAADFHAAFADSCCQAFVGSLQEGFGGGLFQDLEALGVGGVGLDEAQVFGDGAGEELGVLGYEADALAEEFEVDFGAGDFVVEDLAFAGFVEADQEFDEG